MNEDIPFTSILPLREPSSVEEQIESGEIPLAAIAPAPTPPGMAGGPEHELPIQEAAARRVTRWMMRYFGPELERAASSLPPFKPAHLCAIVCQETAYFWLPLWDRLIKDEPFKSQPEELVELILARCVLDASGDHPDHPRNPFPKNTSAFREKYGPEFTAMLIAEANATRALRGFQPKDWVYKGYGIFQYDLQYIEKDEAFFRDRKWRAFDLCLEKVIGELKKKLSNQNGNLWEAIRAYNGSGPRAQRYRENVETFFAWADDEISKTPAPAAAHPPAAAAPQPAAAALPPARPALTRDALALRLKPFAIDRSMHPLIVVGIRGYYRDTLGLPGVNDRGIYDDALFIDAPDTFVAFNGNTDPSRIRRGRGFGDETKGMARLKPGAWFAHCIDYHNGQYLALCQRVGDVTVIRDGLNGDYEDTGRFGINIHRGGHNGTSSLGCQTLHPDQWPAFINLVIDLAKRHHGDKWRKATIPYVLLDATA